MKAELPLASQRLPGRGVILIGTVLLGCFLVLVLSVVLGKDSKSATLLLDYTTLSLFPYPLTIQNLMHLIFFLGLGEIFVRWKVAIWERDFVDKKYLPEDEQTVLQAQDLGPIRRKVAKDFDADNGFLPYLIDLCVLQFQASRSVDQTVSVLNSSLEIIAHRLDLRYALMRYLVWVIPTIGFIGTVVGIAGALTYVDPEKMDLKQVTANLAVAFNTTIIALAQSAVLVLFQNSVQKQEETSLNLAGNYCLKNLINRLYAGGH
jgi:biopolymer transport protein ExbB/TolQ